MHRSRWAEEYERFRKSDLVGGAIVGLIISAFLFGMDLVGLRNVLLVFAGVSVAATLMVWKGRSIEM